MKGFFSIPLTTDRVEHFSLGQEELRQESIFGTSHSTPQKKQKKILFCLRFSVKAEKESGEEGARTDR